MRLGVEITGSPRAVSPLERLDALADELDERQLYDLASQARRIAAALRGERAAA